MRQILKIYLYISENITPEPAAHKSSNIELLEIPDAVILLKFFWDLSLMTVLN